MGFFFVLGLVVFLYYLLYIVVIFISDCDMKTFFTEKFGKKIDELSGKVIWITGASSGIGEHLARSCATVGTKLVLSSRRQNELERVKTDCLKISNGKLSENDILVLPFNVTAIDEHQKLFDKVIEHFGSLDILVNNAGRSQRALWENIEIDVDKSMFDLNVFSVISLTRIAVKYFLAKGEGHVALTSSIAGVVPAPYSGSYTATKQALHGYYNSLRAEKFWKNLSVTVFCPGPTFTNFLQESFTDKMGEKFGQTIHSKDKRMTGERCGHLFAVCLANKVEEPWVAVFPVVPFTYLHCYFPNILRRIILFIGPKLFLKLRDSRVSMKIEE